MKRFRSKFNRVFTALALTLIFALLLPGIASAMASMDSSDCHQQVMCNICISAVVPEIQKIERNHPPLELVENVPQSMDTLTVKPASPPPKS